MFDDAETKKKTNLKTAEVSVNLVEMGEKSRK